MDTESMKKAIRVGCPYYPRSEGTGEGSSYEDRGTLRAEQVAADWLDGSL